MIIGLRISKFLLYAQNKFLFFCSKLFFKPHDSNSDPERILLMRTSALGDFLFSVPAMTALRKRFPKSKIVLLTTSTTNADHNKAVQNYAGKSGSFPWLAFVIPSIIDDAICFYSTNLRILLKEVSPKIKSFNPDLTFILSHPADSASGLLKKLIFLRLLGVKNTVYGWRMRASIQFLKEVQYRAGFFEHKVFGPLRAITESPLMPRIEDIEIGFPITIDQKDEQFAFDFWCNSGLDNSIVIAVAPGSLQPHKRWPIEKFVSLCQQLTTSYGVKQLIIGTKEDKALGDNITANLPTHAYNLAGKTSVQQSAALLKHCVLLVGNDGGAMHLGAAVGCPTVSIIPGIEYQGSVEPWGNKELSVQHPVPCAPCYCFTHCPLNHNQCMTSLPVKDVMAKCSKVLDKEISNMDHHYDSKKYTKSC